MKFCHFKQQTGPKANRKHKGGDIKHQRERGVGVGLTSAAGLLLAKRKSFKGDEERFKISSLQVSSQTEALFLN